MSEIYRKHGRVARFEDGHTVIVDEAGEAIEIGREFEARPLEDKVVLPDIDAGAVERAAHEIRRLVKPHRIERLIVSDGVAEHEFNGVHWTEASRRIHLSLTHRDFRVLIDRGDFDLHDIERIASALGRAQAEREAPPRIRTAPNVSAALLPSLPTIAPPNVELWQRDGGRDGKGKPIRGRAAHLAALEQLVPPQLPRAACADAVQHPGSLRGEAGRHRRSRSGGHPGSDRGRDDARAHPRRGSVRIPPRFGCRASTPSRMR